MTADLKQRIGVRFVFNIADTNQLKNALIGPDTEPLRSDWDIPNGVSFHIYADDMLMYMPFRSTDTEMLSSLKDSL